MPAASSALLHDLLVAERDRLRDGHAGKAERLADLRGQDHPRLPEALDAVDADLARQPLDLAHRRRLVPERAHLQVMRDVLARDRRQHLLRLVAESDHPRADERQSAGEDRASRPGSPATASGRSGSSELHSHRRDRCVARPPPRPPSRDGGRGCSPRPRSSTTAAGRPAAASPRRSGRPRSRCTSARPCTALTRPWPWPRR